MIDFFAASSASFGNFEILSSDTSFYLCWQLTMEVWKRFEKIFFDSFDFYRKKQKESNTPLFHWVMVCSIDFIMKDNFFWNIS